MASADRITSSTVFPWLRWAVMGSRGRIGDNSPAVCDHPQVECVRSRYHAPSPTRHSLRGNRHRGDWPVSMSRSPGATSMDCRSWTENERVCAGVKLLSSPRALRAIIVPASTRLTVSDSCFSIPLVVRCTSTCPSWFARSRFCASVHCSGTYRSIMTLWPS